MHSALHQRDLVMNYSALYKRSLEDRDGFWSEQAERIEWHKPFDRVCDYDKPPFANWFEGGETNQIGRAHV